MQEVAVGQIAFQHPLGKDHHEGFFHGPAGRVIQTPQRQGDQPEHRTDRSPRHARAALPRPAQPWSQPARTAEHERRAIGVRCVRFLIGTARQPASRECDDGHEADGAEHTQRRLGRSAEPHTAVGVRRGDGDTEELDPQGQQRNATATHRDRTHDRQRREAVEHHQTEGAGVVIAALDATEVDVLQRMEQLPLTKHAQGHHARQFVGVGSCVVEPERPPVQRDLRLVAGRFTLRIADLLLTLEIPVSDERPVVHRRTVGVHHHFVAVRRERHEVLERRRVADHPGSQHGDAGRDGHEQMAGPDDSWE